MERGVAGKVRNLVVIGRDRGGRRNAEEFAVNDLWSTFSAVRCLVVADKLFDSSEAGEELVWLRGELGSEGEEEGERAERLVLRKLLLWRDWTKYRLAANIDLEKLRTE
jgi:hypothetical protein